jgi:hypothetical protein
VSQPWLGFIRQNDGSHFHQVPEVEVKGALQAMFPLGNGCIVRQVAYPRAGWLETSKNKMGKPKLAILLHIREIGA